MRLPVPMGMLDLSEAYHFDVLLSQSKVMACNGTKQNAPGTVQVSGALMYDVSGLLNDSCLLDFVQLWEVLFEELVTLLCNLAL